MTNKKEKNAAIIKETLKGIFTKNVALKIISLLFAMVIWGYVMMNQNPDRVKTVSNISVSFEGEADMISRKLIIRGDRQSMISGITARINTQLTNYADLNAASVTAAVSLRNITAAGSYKLPIYATCINGAVQSVSPGSIEVEIDNLVTKRIPVEYKIVSALPEGYWADTPVLSRSEIDIQGPSQDISAITKGICFINLSNRTAAYNEAMAITLMDNAGNALDTSILYGQLAAVSVQQTILPKKELAVDAEGALLGADNLANNYEITAVRVEPETIEVAAEKSVLDAMTALQVESINVAGRSESLLVTAPIVASDGIILLDDTETASIYVDIREKQAEVDYVQLPIKVRDVKRGLTATPDAEALDIAISGPVSLLNRLTRGDVALYVEATDLEAGVYSLPVKVDLPSEKMESTLQWTLSADNVNVTLSK